MSKPNVLEQLLTAFSKTEKLRDDTDALRIRLEAEIAAALASGDVLDEKFAASLQIKRGQLDLVPGKLAQLSTRLASLTAEIQTEFDQRNIAFSRAVQAARNAEKDRVSAIITPILSEAVGFKAEGYVEQICSQSKLALKLLGLESPIQFQLAVHQNPVAAARLLLVAEKEFASLNP